MNIDKCQAIIFSGQYNSVRRKTKKQTKDIQVKINNNVIPLSKSIKYLGIVFTSNLNFNKHVDNIMSKTIKIYHMLSHLLINRNGIQNNVKLLLYKQLIRPLIGYAFVIWQSISSAQMERIRILERKIVRLCIGLKREQNS